jgi:hypothetical protein
MRACWKNNISRQAKIRRTEPLTSCAGSSMTDNKEDLTFTKLRRSSREHSTKFSVYPFVHPSPSHSCNWRLTKDLEWVERLGLPSVESKCLTSDVPRAASIGLIRGRADPSRAVAAEGRSHAVAGSTHNQIERAAAREGDTGRTGRTADRLDDGVVLSP